MLSTEIKHNVFGILNTSLQARALAIRNIIIGRTCVSGNIYLNKENAMGQLQSTIEALSTWAQAMHGILLMATMVLFVVGGAALLVYAISPKGQSKSGSSKGGGKPSLAISRSGSGGSSLGQRSSNSSRYRDDDCGGGFSGGSFGGGGSGCGGGDGGGGGCGGD
jgi:hypothetical protein